MDTYRKKKKNESLLTEVTPLEMLIADLIVSQAAAGPAGPAGPAGKRRLCPEDTLARPLANALTKRAKPAMATLTSASASFSVLICPRSQILFGVWPN